MDQNESEETGFEAAVKRLMKIRSPGAANKARKESLNWYSKKMKRRITKGSLSDLLRGRKEPTAFKPGQMLTYAYSSKLFAEGKLDYYDKAPLIIFLGIQKNGNMLGLNLHYLPPDVRARILSMLMKPIRAKKMRHDTRMRITYQMVSSIAAYAPLQFALKSYIPSRFKSKMVRIPSREWQHVIFLPTARFVGKSNKGVWKAGGF